MAMISYCLQLSEAEPLSVPFMHLYEGSQMKCSEPERASPSNSRKGNGYTVRSKILPLCLLVPSFSGVFTF